MVITSRPGGGASGAQPLFLHPGKPFAQHVGTRLHIKPSTSAAAIVTGAGRKLQAATSPRDLKPLIDRVSSSVNPDTLQARIQLARAILNHPHVTTEHIRKLVYAIPLSAEYKVPDRAAREAQQAWLDEVLNHPATTLPIAHLILLHWGPLRTHLTINLPEAWEPLVTAVTQRLERSTSTLRDTHAGEFTQYVIDNEPNPVIHLAIADLLNSNWEGSLWLAYETAKASHEHQPVRKMAPDPHWYVPLA